MSVEPEAVLGTTDKQIQLLALTKKFLIESLQC